MLLLRPLPSAVDGFFVGVISSVVDVKNRQQGGGGGWGTALLLRGEEGAGMATGGNSGPSTEGSCCGSNSTAVDDALSGCCSAAGGRQWLEDSCRTALRADDSCARDILTGLLKEGRKGKKKKMERRVWCSMALL